MFFCIFCRGSKRIWMFVREYAHIYTNRDTARGVLGYEPRPGVRAQTNNDWTAQGLGISDGPNLALKTLLAAFYYKLKMSKSESASAT